MQTHPGQRHFASPTSTFFLGVQAHSGQRLFAPSTSVFVSPLPTLTPTARYPTHTHAISHTLVVRELALVVSSICIEAMSLRSLICHRLTQSYVVEAIEESGGTMPHSSDARHLTHTWRANQGVFEGKCSLLCVLPNARNLAQACTHHSAIVQHRNGATPSTLPEGKQRPRKRTSAEIRCEIQPEEAVTTRRDGMKGGL